MNVLWITKICAYKHTENCIASAKAITELKNKRRQYLLKKYKHPVKNYGKDEFKNIPEVLLYEARVAKYFWRQFSLILPDWCNFKTRKPFSKDITNRLLDIGYHRITNEVKKIFGKYEISPALGILHVAGKSDSTPLCYDMVEMFRADIVESEVIRFLHLKKKLLSDLSQQNISLFLRSINKRLEQKHYLKQFRQCHTYRYYMEIQILGFIKAVNHKKIFRPIHLPVRHDVRCQN